MEASEARTVSGPVGCGWLGAKGRATSDATAGLTLMGVRLYNQATGTFTSTDPVPGGSSTAYNYPTDVVSIFDLTDRCGSTSTVVCRSDAT
ncbi:RHS repeat-associated core domain-containing protein [Dermabacter sp. HFH0086]|nr:RHS repeat-associated core domain-containing protein [Dermabacter sp. HFH0086]